MQRIQGLMPDQRELAMQVLAWVTCSQRPLAAIELQHALAIEIGESQFDEDNVPDIEDMLSVCAGLVTLDEQTHTVRLVHYTTQEFFERTWHQWFPDAHRDIASTCITYLSYDVFDLGACTSDQDLNDRLNTYPLYRYSSVNWGDHARHQCVDTTLALKLLMNRNKVAACSQVLCLDKRLTGWKIPTDVSGPHLVAHFGLEEILRKLLETSIPCDEEDSRGMTPLFWAAANGQEALARRLIEAGVEIQFEEPFFSPVAVAASNGHEAVVQVLLQAGVDPDIEDMDGRTALSRAAENGHDAVVKLLLGYLASIDREDCNNRTALLWAARHGHDTTVRILLEAGAEPDSSDNEYSWTALSWACFNGHLEVTRLLLEAGANLASQDINGWTPLSFAVENGHAEVVQLLLDRGADMDMIHNDGLSALALAAENGSQTVVTMLLEQGTHKRQSKGGHLILLLNAVSRGKCHYTKLLLHEAGVADMLSPADTHAALTLAVWKRHASIAKLLLEHGTEVDYRRPAFVQYPSSSLFSNGSMGKIVLVFKDGEPGLEVEDALRKTLLTCAAQLGHEKLVEMLLDAGANPCATDIDGRTPLIYAAAYGHVSVSRVLVEAGIDITITDKFGRTALLSAVGEGTRQSFKCCSTQRWPILVSGTAMAAMRFMKRKDEDI
jgi:ankyrin repeat protein